MNKEQKAIFATRLGLLRNSLKISQKELSSKVQIGRETIAKYETQKRIPSYEHLAVFAKFFNVSTDYLIGLTDVSSIELDLKAVCDYTGLADYAILSIKDTLSHADSMYEVSKESYIRSLNQLLSSDEFYHALYLLTLLKKASITAIDKKKSEPAIIKIYTCIDDYYRKKINSENENENIICDLLKYKITSDFEHVTALFDIRTYDKRDTVLRDIIIKEEAADNGKHPLPKE